MKKTLLILLALLAATTITLTACSDSGKTPVDDGGDENDDIETVDDSTDEVDETDDATDGETDNGTVNNGYEEKNDTVYAGVNGLNLRASGSTSADVLKQVNMGTALTRIATNGTWDQVKVNGSETVYYVQSKWVSTNASNFEFTELEEPVEVTLSTASKAGNVCFWQTPHIAWVGKDYDYTNILLASGLKASNLKDATITKIAYNNNWIKVKFVGTIEVSANSTATYTEENPGVFYIRTKSITDKNVIDPSFQENNGGGGIG